MIHLVLLGPPGAGKGTQAERLAAHYGLKHLSTGAMFRHHIGGQTRLGGLAQGYMDKGRLVPDGLTIDMLEEAVSRHADVKGFVFDGFPRTLAQAKALDDFLDQSGASILKALSLEVADADLLVRLRKRGREGARMDDSDERVIRDRIAAYHEQTAPLAGYYRGRDKLESIDGLGPIDAISERLIRIVDRALPC
ncbi:MAG: adenylate kinase [Flavobacteriales bacterium]